MIYAVDIGWLWVVYLGLVIVVCSAAVRDGSGWGAFWVAVLGTMIFVLLSPLAVATIHWTWEHRAQWPYWVAVYVVLGIGWGVVKWFLYVGLRARDYERREANLRDEHQRSFSKNDESYSAWLMKWKDIPPQPSKHRDRIVTWMTWWPFSFLESVFSDILRRAYEAIYDELAALLGRISKRAFRRFEGLQ